MPYSCEVDEQRRIILVKFTERLTDEAMREYYEQGRGLYAALPAPAAMIYDLSAVTALEMSSDTVHAIAKSAPHFADPVARFIVAPRDHVFGMARMFQSLGEPSRQNLQVVRSLKEVYRQLGVSEPAFEPLTAG